jgi:23S rRNA (uracil1939-C5)-methyltransferase
MDMNPVEVTIDSCATGGDGVGRIHGKVVFVPKTLPGEHVTVIITEERKDYARGNLVSLLDPSQFRTSPRCPLEGECGGCGFQHITYKGQLEVKKNIFLDLLVRVGKVNLADLLPRDIQIKSSLPLRYRNRAQVHRGECLDPAESCLGFMKRSGKRVVKIQYCPVVVEGINQVFRYPEDFFTTGRGRLEGRGKAGGTLKRETDRRVVFSSSEGTFIEGRDREARVVLLDREFSFPPGSFFQSNCTIFQDLISDLMYTIPKNRERFFDLYGGVGVFSVLFSDFFHESWVVEKDLTVKKWIEKNRPESRRFGYIPLSVEEWIQTKPDLRNSLVLLDPPRGGLSKEVREYLFSGVLDDCVYLSCNPATFARDLGEAVRAGFTVSWINLYDFFPQTPHFEVAAILNRKSSG